MLYAWFAAEWDRRRFGFATGENGVRIARMLYGLDLLSFGLTLCVILEYPSGTAQ